MILVIILCTKVYTSTSEIIKRHLKNKKSLWLKKRQKKKKTQAALENSLNSKKYYNYNHNISKFIFIFGVWISLHHHDKFKLSLHSR